MTTVAASTRRIGPPRLGALVRSEILRARSRRSLFWLGLLSVLGVLAMAAIMWFTTAHVTQAELDRASADFMAEQQGYYEQCLADPGIPESQKEGACWKPNEQDAAGNALWYLHRRPVDQSTLQGMVGLTGGISLLVALLLAATTGGADWGARTMGLVLSWEPRRSRVFLVRLVVAALVALLLQAVLLLLTVVAGALIAGAHDLAPDAAAALGSSFEPVDLGAVQEFALRWLPLTALAAAGSFAVAMLARSTGWAIGASIGFVAVVESVLGALWPWVSQFLVQTNVGAWLSGGVNVMVDRAAAQTSGFVPEGQTAGFVHISEVRGLTTLAVVALTVVVLSWIAFRRRDVK